MVRRASPRAFRAPVTSRRLSLLRRTPGTPAARLSPACYPHNTRVDRLNLSLLSHSLTREDLVAVVLRAATSLGRQGQWSAAALLLEHAREFAPGERRLRVLLAEALSESGYFAEAADLLEAVLREAPGEAAARYHLAGCLAGLQRYTEALEAAKAALAAEPANLLFQERVRRLNASA